MSRGARKTVEYTDAPGETWLLKQEDAVVARCPLRLPIFSATSPYRETTVLREPVGENAPASRLDAPARLLRVRQKRKTKILRGAQSAELDSDELGSAKRYEGRHLLHLALDVRPGRQPIGELTAAPEPRPSQRGC